MFSLENSFTEFPDLVNVTQLMKMLQIGKNTSYNLLTSHKIEAMKIGRDYKIPKQNVINYLNEMMEEQ